MPYGSQGLVDLTSLRNFLINGDCLIQQDISGPVVFGGPFAGSARTWADRWRLRGTWAGGETMQCGVNQNLHPLLPTGYSLSFQPSAMGANTDCDVYIQWVARNCAAYANSIMLLDFWILSSTTGERSVAVQTTNSLTSYVMPFTIRTANAWQRVSLPFVFAPVNVGAGSGYATIAFPAAIGANALAGRRAAAPNVWTAGNRTLAPGTSPLCSASGGLFRLADVQVIAGPTPTPYDRVPFNTELARCRAWFCMSYDYQTVPGTLTFVGQQRFAANVAAAGANSSPTFPYIVPMVASPTVTIYNPEVANNQVRRLGAADCTASAADMASNQGFSIACNGDAGSVIGSPLGFHWVADMGA
jgi:hypothetical protein